MSNLRSLVPNERFTLAFYGIDRTPEAAQGFFFLSANWLAELGCSPDKLAVGRTGRAGGKVGDYGRIRARLEKAGFSDVESFDIHASTPGALVPGLDYSASVSFAQPIRHGGYAVIAVPSSLAIKEGWLPVAENIIQNIRPAYGIGFKRDLALGPVWYALGVNYGGEVVPTGEAYEAARNVSRWCDMGMVHRVWQEGLLRDVYPWNFLSGSQLAKPIEGASLEEWIRQDGNRGTLSRLVHNVVLWEVEEARIPELRRQLQEAGVIFDWRKHQ